MNRRELIRVIGGAAAVPILTGCTVLDARHDERTVVEIDSNSTFQPGGVTITVGETVVWRNNDSRPHRLSTEPDSFEGDVPVSVPEGAKTFTSVDLVTNDRFTHTFEVAGDYIYACTIHPHMIGTVSVRPAES